jgi:hypothetical protein
MLCTKPISLREMVMSELDDLIAEGLTIAEDTIVTDTFMMDRGPYTGILNMLEGTEGIELGGILCSFNVTLVCKRAQFRAGEAKSMRQRNR